LWQAGILAYPGRCDTRDWQRQYRVPIRDRVAARNPGSPAVCPWAILVQAWMLWKSRD